MARSWRLLVKPITSAKTLRVALSGGRSYDVIVGRKIDFIPHLPKLKLLWAYDPRAGKPRADISIALPSGEAAKSFRAWERLIDFLIKHDDGTPMALVAYGGGAIGDAVGFAAATYRRGIPFVQIPTTLLAMVDASVGGKTAINHPRAKNMIGAFHQPAVVIADLDRLKTLPARHMRSGLAEAVKHGLIGDEALFQKLERKYAELEYIVERSVRLKARVVAADERETKGLREILNFGHTLGHAIEAYHGYKKFTHGEAIAVGMAAAARVSRDVLGFSEVDRVDSVLRSVGLPVRLTREKTSSLIELTRRDKKRRSEKVRMTLLEKIGRPKVIEIEERVFARAIEEIR